MAEARAIDWARRSDRYPDLATWLAIALYVLDQTVSTCPVCKFEGLHSLASGLVSTEGDPVGVQARLLSVLGLLGDQRNTTLLAWDNTNSLSISSVLAPLP